MCSGLDVNENVKPRINVIFVGAVQPKHKVGTTWNKYNPEFSISFRTCRYDKNRASPNGGLQSRGRGVRIFWCKTSDFSKFMVCPHAQGGGRGVESVRTFCGQRGRGLFFRFFVWTFFIDGPYKKDHTKTTSKLIKKVYKIIFNTLD